MKNKHIERFPDWRKSIAKILNYLDENPFEMIYDPADDELSESFKLERFLSVSLKDKDEYGKSNCSLYYCEFDQRFIAYQKSKGEIDMNDLDGLLDILWMFLFCYDKAQVPFYVRVYEIKNND